MTDDDNETWTTFSEIGINARMRNALELFRMRKEAAPTVVDLEGRTAGALTSANEGNTDGEERVAAANAGIPAPTAALPPSWLPGEEILVKRA